MLLLMKIHQTQGKNLKTQGKTQNSRKKLKTQAKNSKSRHFLNRRLPEMRSKRKPDLRVLSVFHQDGFLGKFERVYPDDSVGVEERLPKHYMDFHNQWKKGPQSSIHQIVPQEK